MLRVVQIGTNKLPCPPPKGGAIERYIYGISKGLAKNGVEVHIISLPGWERSSMFKHMKNIIYHSINFDRYGFLFSNPLLEVSFVTYFGRKISKVIKSIEKDYGEVDIISSHFPTTSFGPLYFKKKNTKVTILYHVHNTYGGKRVSNLLMRLYLKHILAHYDLVCGVSNFVKNWLIKELGLSRQRVTVIYNAIDDDIFKPLDMKRRGDLRKLYGLKDYFTLLFVGRITPDKGLDQIIKALILLKREGFDKLRLLIVGPKGQFYKKYKKYYNYVSKMINLYNLGDMVKYLGYVPTPDIPHIYGVSDVVLLPSLFEDPCPSVLLESLACGRPVIAYDSGGIKELIPPGGGLVVTKGDIRALANAIKLYLRGDVKVDSSSISEYALSKFSYNAVAKDLLKLYKVRS